MKKGDIKAVFFDIDGTLVSFKTHRIPDSARLSLDRLRENGILTFVATGRHISEINNLGTWKPDGFVTLNGGYCVVGGEVVCKCPIDPRDIDALTDKMERETFYPFIFVDENHMWMNYSNQTVSDMLKMVGLTVPNNAPIEELARKEIYQLMGFFSEEQEPSVMELLPHCHPTRWTDTFTDIVPVGVDKWSGIAKVIERFGIAPDEVMAFGDGGNDVDMIQGAGVGIAMGNARDFVKREADYVTTSVEHNGIERALRHFGLI